MRSEEQEIVLKPVRSGQLSWECYTERSCADVFVCDGPEWSGYEILVAMMGGNLANALML